VKYSSQTCVSAAAKTLGGADPMAEPVMGNGAPAEGDAQTEDYRDEAGDEVEDFVWGGLEKTPKTNRNSHMHTMVSADTPSAKVTTPSDSEARRATFDNLRFATVQGYTPIIART
jgi:hypothetical protein